MRFFICASIGIEYYIKKTLQQDRSRTKDSTNRWPFRFDSMGHGLKVSIEILMMLLSCDEVSRA